VPAIGMKATALAAALGYLALVPVSVATLRRLIPLGLCLPAGLLAVSLDLVLVSAPAGSRVIELRQGVMAVVAVTEDASGGRLLKVNDRFFMGGTVRSFADRRQAHIPLLLHPNPKSALFLGVGSGMTVGAATHHVGTVRGVELVPEVIPLLGHFAPGNRLDHLAEGDIVVADARRFVRATEERFDVIVADLFQPGRDGSGALYTREHFEAIAGRLEPGGVFCQWLPVHQLAPQTLKLIVRTFVEVYPDARAFMAHYNIQTPMLGLVAGTRATRYGRDWYARRLGGRPDTRAALVEVALADELALFACFMADADTLRAFGGDGAISTDDHPRVTFDAPAFTYLGDRMDGEPLRWLIETWEPRAEMLVTPARSGFATSLDRVLEARDLFIEATITDLHGDRDGAIDGALASVMASAEFRASYAYALKLASDARASDPATARAILVALRETRPEFPQAEQLLREWFGE
jgi:spermidine synthase